MINYATLYQLRRYPGFTTTQTSDDDLLTFLLDKSSRAIDDYFDNQFTFDPVYETRYFDVPRTNCLSVGKSLLGLSAIANGDGESVDPSFVSLLPNNFYPKTMICLKPVAGINWIGDQNNLQIGVIGLTGLWGFHNRYPSAFVNSLDTITTVGGINASVSTFTVTDSDGVAVDLDSPRFQAGHLIKVENEFMLISDVNNSTNTLTVGRGYNGTTAAIHAQGTTIGIYRPMANIVMAAIRLTIWRYRQKDVNSFDRTTILNTGISIIPSALPPDVIQLLSRIVPQGLSV